MIAIEERLTVVEDRLAELEERVAKLEDRVIAVEERLTKLEDRVTAVEERLEAAEERLIKIDVVLENEVFRNIGILAENHIEINRKYNTAIQAQTNTGVLEVLISGYKERLEKVEKEMAELKAKIA